MPETIDTKYFAPLHRVTSVKRIENGVDIVVDDALLRVEILRPEVARLSITTTGVFDEQPTFAVVAAPAAKVPHTVVEDPMAVHIKTGRMDIVVGRTPFRIDAYRSDGSVIFETACVDDSPAAYTHLNDQFLIARACRPNDMILGLGEKTGRLNRMGRSFTMWNTDVLNPDASGAFTANRDKSDPRSDKTSVEFDPYYVSIPFFHHLSHDTGQAAGFFIDNGYRSHFEFQHGGQYRFHFAGGQYTEYVFAGPELTEIIGAYTGLTGRMSPPPIWALGYHQCRWYPYTQPKMESLGAEFRERRLPCDSLWFDIEHMDGYRVFTWNEKLFPCVPAMIEQLSELGFRAVSIVDPGVKAEPGYEVFDDGMAADLFCLTECGKIYTGQVWPGKTAFPDFTDPEARRWWGKRNADLVESGIAGIWNDMNEPATGDIPDGAMRFGRARFSHERFHNQYGLLMAMATYEGLTAARPETRPFILSRAGFAGIQRYAANWMGDNMARWDHLQLSLPMALGFGLSGQPFVGADIGGFAEDTTPELFLRWMQCGALTPFCRNHSNSGCIDQYPWSFGQAVEDLCRKSLELRYKLMPALYSAFLDSAQTGLPVQRPLALADQADATGREIEDQYLLGDHLLVAPVFAAGQTARHVYLPLGSWHDFHTGETLMGGRFTIAATPLAYIPVYVRGGAVIPQWPEAPASTKDYRPAVLELHVFAPLEEGIWRSRLHEDDGLTFARDQGDHWQTDLQVTHKPGALTIEANVTGNGFPEFARQEFEIVLHGATAKTAALDGRPAAFMNNRLRIANTGHAFRLEAKL